MAPVDLDLVRFFASVYETGSFSVAAQRLGVPRSTVSRAVASLEAGLGTILFHRTTRKLAATQDGRALYDRVGPSLIGLESALSDWPSYEQGPSGKLRVTTTTDLGTTLLAEAVTRFTTRYPNVTFEAHVTNEMVDLVKDAVDVALRVRVASSRDSSLIARKLGAIKFRLYAAPSYLARFRAPRTLDELAKHQRVALGRVSRLPFPAAESKSHPAARVVCNDIFFLREVLRNGGGIGALPSYVADADVANGTLAGVLPAWELHVGDLFFVHPGRKHVPAKVTAFRDLVVEMLRQRPLTAARGTEAGSSISGPYESAGFVPEQAAQIADQPVRSLRSRRTDRRSIGLSGRDRRSA